MIFSSRAVRRPMLLAALLGLLATGGCAALSPWWTHAAHPPRADLRPGDEGASNDPAERQRLSQVALGGCTPAERAAGDEALHEGAVWWDPLRRFWSNMFGQVTIRLDVTAMSPTFCETFGGPLDISDREHNPDGRWRTNYWFGSDGYVHDYKGNVSQWPDNASSRMLDREVQLYSDPNYAPELPSPFSTQGGALTISALANPDPRNPKVLQPNTGQVARYISGLITTQNSFSQTYGYFEAVVSLSSVRGAFPAFWLLGEPYTTYQNDEIDIFEQLGKFPQKLWMSTVLPRLSLGTSEKMDGIDMSRPRAVGLLWTPDRLTWFIDREPVYTTANAGYHQPMYMLLNQAVGGWDGNMPEDAAAFPARMKIYSVRAWTLPPPGGRPIFKLR